MYHLVTRVVTRGILVTGLISNNNELYELHVRIITSKHNYMTNYVFIVSINNNNDKMFSIIINCCSIRATAYITIMVTIHGRFFGRSTLGIWLYQVLYVYIIIHSFVKPAHAKSWDENVLLCASFANRKNSFLTENPTARIFSYSSRFRTTCGIYIYWIMYIGNKDNASSRISYLKI